MLEITNNQGLKVIPADNGKGPHATSSSSLPPLGLNKRMIQHFTHTSKKYVQFLKAEHNDSRVKSLFHYLDGPVVSPDLSCREPTRGASLLLDVEGNLHSRF